MSQSFDMSQLKLGIFHGPHHDKMADPQVLLERDFWLMEHLDGLGYDEAWIGEHHSGGFEMIAAPELFIAAAAERTRHIRFGTGVKSLPYHNPLIAADTMAQLDHQLRGRAIFGVGPGALASDAQMMGIQPAQQRPRLEEALAAVVPLLQGETVTLKTDWFDLQDARLGLGCYTKPMIEMAVTSVRSPAGVVQAGRYGLGLLTLGGINDDALSKYAQNWAIYEAECARHGHIPDRSKFRITTFVHLAETREKAFEDVQWGLEKWIDYSHDVVSAGHMVERGLDDPAKFIAENQRAIIGTPDDAVAEIQRVWDGVGGFGGLLMFGMDWAPPAATWRSFELMAEYVRPRLTGANQARQGSYDFAKANQDDNRIKVRGAIQTATEKFETESGEAVIRRAEFGDK